MEPKWLGMGECVIFQTLKLEFLGRSHYKESFHQDHILSYNWWMICFFQIEHYSQIHPALQQIPAHSTLEHCLRLVSS